MDAQALVFENESFDLVIGNGILHHLSDLKKSLSESTRVLRENGYAIFTEPLGINPFINFFRFFTPSMRTKDEHPLTMKDLKLIMSEYPEVEFYFFDCATLISKMLLALHLKKFAYKLQIPLLKIDEVILKNNNNKKVTFWQKLSWRVIIKIKYN